MLNYNGDLLASDTKLLSATNRGFLFGEALFESIRYRNGLLHFWESHYFRLMASMRILRMEIPMAFTMEFLEQEIKEVIRQNNTDNNDLVVRLSVFRKAIADNSVNYIIEIANKSTADFQEVKTIEVLELFKDFYVNADLLSTLNTNNQNIKTVASIYARENGYSDCLLLNSSKNVVEAIHGNVFLRSGNVVKTPPLNDGCLNGILRKKVMEQLKNEKEYTFEEASISPFELQKADELFLTHTTKGFYTVKNYRKKAYQKALVFELAKKWIEN